MSNCSKYVNVVVQLADKRVLLYQGRSSIYYYETDRRPLSITIEELLIGKENALEVANEIIQNIFGINPHSYTDAFATMTRLAQIQHRPNKTIIPFLIKLKTGLAFQAKPTDYFTATKWSTVLKEVMAGSVYQTGGNPPKHTPVAIGLARELTARGVFD